MSHKIGWRAIEEDTLHHPLSSTHAHTTDEIIGEGGWKGDREKDEGGRGRRISLNLSLCNIDREILIMTIVTRVDPVPLKFGIKSLQLNYLKVSQVPNQCSASHHETCSPKVPQSAQR